MVLEKQEPPPSGFDAQKDQIRENLLGQKRAEVYQLFIETLQQRLEKEGKIRVNGKRDGAFSA